MPFLPFPSELEHGLLCPHIQMSLGLFVATVFLVFQSTARPYLVDRLDVLEVLCSLSIFFYVLAGIFFAVNDSDFSHEQKVCRYPPSTYRMIVVIRN